MLVPEFKLSQTQNYITVSIRVPYVKITSCQFYIQPKLFKFCQKPYILTLGFQQKLKQVVEPVKAVFNYQKHLLTVDLEKQKKGEEFQNLNALQTLVSKACLKKGKEIKVLVQQNLQKGKFFKKEQQNAYSYGFCGNFHQISKQIGEIFMFDPTTVLQQDRYELSRKIVLEAFDENAYMFDKVSNFQEIDKIVEGKWHQKLIKSIRKLQKQPFTYEKFITMVKQKPIKKNYEKNMNEAIINQLISIVFCFIYQYACTDGLFGPDSVKTMIQTSAVLSCNVLYDKLPILKVIHDCCRRCVTFSRLKHIEICQRVCKLFGQILSQNLIIEVFLQLRTLFQKSQGGSTLNKIYIDEYCAYILNIDLKNQLLMIKQKLSVDQIGENELQLELEITQEDLYASNRFQGNVEQMDLQNLLSFD